MNKEKLFKAKSSWILPSGEIMYVPGEEHDDYLPNVYKTLEQTEKVCIRVSCVWDWNASISTIQLPDRLSTHQAKVLKDIEETLNQNNISIKNKIEWYKCGYGWNYVLEQA